MVIVLPDRVVYFVFSPYSRLHDAGYEQVITEVNENIVGPVGYTTSVAITYTW